MMTNRLRTRLILSIALFTFCFSLYLKTLSNQVYTADCGELIAASYVLGIPHATGYSSYCLFNRVAATFVPFGSVAFRMSLTSALFAAAGVVFMFLYLASFFSVFSSAFGALLLGVSLTFWSQAVIQEVYSLHMFFLCIVLYLAGNLSKDFTLSRLYLFLFVSGLSITNHALAVFMFPALLLHLWPERRTWYPLRYPCLAGITFFVFGVSTMLYFPLRSAADSVIRWKICHDWKGFVFHVTGRQFRNLMFNQTLEKTIANISQYWDKLLLQFPLLFLIAAVLGAVVLFFRFRKLWFVFFVYFFLVVLFFLHYRIIDIEVYYLQSYIPVLVCITAGLDFIFRCTCRIRFVPVYFFWLIFLISAISWNVLKDYYSNDRSRNFLVFDWGMNVYNCVPPDGLLVTQGWSSPFVFFYFDHILNYRPDILVQVDYKGSTFFLAADRGWDIPVVSTLPIEIPGINEDDFLIHGVVYQFDRHGVKGLYPSVTDGYMRTRCLWDSSLFLDFHSQALKAKYLIIEGFWKLERDDRPGAEDKFRQAEEQAFTNPLIYNNLACVFFKLGQFTRAEQMALQALEIDPGLVPAHHNLGNALIRLGRYQEAIDAFEEIKDNVVSLGRQREALGYLYLLSGECEKAQRQFRRALNLFPQSRSAKMNLGISQHLCADYAAALITFNELVECCSDQLEVFANRANVYIALERYDLAFRDIETVLKAVPGHFEVRLAKSVALHETSKTNDALHLLYQLHRESPANTSVLNNLGLLFFKAGDYESAIMYWEKSIDLNPDQAHIRKSLRQLRFDREFLKN